MFTLGISDAAAGAADATLAADAAVAAEALAVAEADAAGAAAVAEAETIVCQLAACLAVTSGLTGVALTGSAVVGLDPAEAAGGPQGVSVPAQAGAPGGLVGLVPPSVPPAFPLYSPAQQQARPCGSLACRPGSPITELRTTGPTNCGWRAHRSGR